MKTVCQVCMHHCSLEPGRRGICGARKNEGGNIICENYGRVTSIALDPIEKKPLKMFYPGSLVLSVGSYGCNLKCPFCQNHEISMMNPGAPQPDARYRMQDVVYVSPRELAEKALEYKAAGNIGAAFTYNEPLVGWEYVRDAAKLVKELGMKNILVTNGTASLEVLEELLPFIDAMNIDLKGFREDYYKKLGGDLNTVKAFITRAAAGCHVELTTLIVPGENDGIREMEEEARWIASIGNSGRIGKTEAADNENPAYKNSGKKIPLHITRFFPRYHMTDRNATDVSAVYRLANAAGKYLENVFAGNC